MKIKGGPTYFIDYFILCLKITAIEVIIANQNIWNQ